MYAYACGYAYVDVYVYVDVYLYVYASVFVLNMTLHTEGFEGFHSSFLSPTSAQQGGALLAQKP